MGKVIYGNSNFGYAPINYSGGSYSFGTPVMLKGMVSSSAEVEENNEKVYADNSVWCVINGAKVRTLTSVFRYIPNEYATYFGFKIHDNGFITDTGVKPSHCVFFETTEKDCDTGEETKTLHYFYNVTANEPNEETNTVEESIEAAELEVEYNAIESQFVADKDGKMVAYAKITRTEQNKNLYDTFTTVVLKPTDSI